MAVSEATSKRFRGDVIEPVNPNTPGLLLLQAIAGGLKGVNEARETKRSGQAERAKQEMAFLSSIGSGMASSGQLGFNPAYEGQRPLYEPTGGSAPVYARNPMQSQRTIGQAMQDPGGMSLESSADVKRAMEIKASLAEEKFRNTPFADDELDSLHAALDAYPGVSLEFTKNVGGVPVKYKINDPDLFEVMGRGDTSAINPERSKAALGRRKAEGKTVSKNDLVQMKLALGIFADPEYTGTVEDILELMIENGASEKAVEEIKGELNSKPTSKKTPKKSKIFQPKGVNKVLGGDLTPVKNFFKSQSAKTFDPSKRPKSSRRF